MDNLRKLGFGCMRLPRLPGGEDKDIDLKAFTEMVDYYLAAGYDYFDTAYMYHGGESERAVKTALTSRYPRDKFRLTTKLPLWDAKSHDDFDKIITTQLEKTGAGYFDIYLLHGINGKSVAMLDELDGWSWLKKQKEIGRAKHIGFSFHATADVLENVLSKHPEIEYVQLQLNYIDWDSKSVQSRLCYETCAKYGVKVIVMEPVKGGALAAMPDDIRDILIKANPNVSVASWAIRFAADLPSVAIVLSGMSDLSQLKDNIETFNAFKPLSDAEKAVIGKVIDALNAVPTIPCTSCRYCVNDCPQKINIPSTIALLNDVNKYRNIESNLRRYNMNNAKASDCVECGNCENHCPQNLPIRTILKDVVKVFGK